MNDVKSDQSAEKVKMLLVLGASARELSEGDTD
jgi:hypothetical protein